MVVLPACPTVGVVNLVKMLSRVRDESFALLVGGAHGIARLVDGLVEALETTLSGAVNVGELGVNAHVPEDVEREDAVRIPWLLASDRVEQDRIDTR